MSETGAEPRQLLSVVVPALNEAEGIGEFYRRTAAVLGGQDDLDHELIFVDDGSTDDTFATLCRIAEEDERVQVLKLSRNFGHQVAISAGIDHAAGDAIVVIDADLQDPPEVIGNMVARWREGHDVVYGRRSGREGESRLKLWTATIFYRILRRMTQVDIPVDVGDFRLVSRRVADQLRCMTEKDRFVRGLVSWIGFRQTAVPYRREARHVGETKYPFRKMLRFAVDGITSFSTVPLRLASWLGFLASSVAFLYLLSVPIQYFFDITVPGFSTIMVAILFLGGVQLICIGIIGEYIGRIFNEVKPRPMYVLEETVGPKAAGLSPLRTAGEESELS